LKSSAGTGVNLPMWIIDNRSGRWPSRDPTKNNLEKKVVRKQTLRPQVRENVLQKNQTTIPIKVSIYTT